MTLVEMLVVVALVILMMVILVQIFQSATGAMSASRAIQELDVELRQFDLRLRQDLAGVTSGFTPPNDPSLKKGYFEYGENAFADLQGEDSDDYVAFTTKAPEGQVFTGRIFIPNSTGNNNVAGNLAVQPVTVTSELAEIVYFLRNGNLYRRVFLIVPERETSLFTSVSNRFQALSPNVAVGFLGVNDVSARPISIGTGITVGNGGASNTLTAVPNDLGDLTNRENRIFRPRFRSDYYAYNSSNGQTTFVPDGVDDDNNADDVPDYYPTLYPNVFAAGLTNEYSPNGHTPGYNYRTLTSYGVHAFPFIYPGMYSHPDPNTLATGWIHSLDPTGKTFNHNPLPVGPGQPGGDNLAIPLAANQFQTWWGFPTWRETLSQVWRDPVAGIQIGTPPTQYLGLQPFPPNAIPATNSTTFLPPVTAQYGNDGAGSASFAAFEKAPGVWDDDLVLTNVRSFDVKAYDPDAPLYNNGSTYFPTGGYYDLGYGVQGNAALATATGVTSSNNLGGIVNSLWGSDNQPQGFGHAGRIPPLVADARLNPSRPSFGGSINNFNVGDNGGGTGGFPVIRLTRVWDSWSTDYTNAPDVDIFLNGTPGLANDKPIYPSYPAPYTTPLRGIQVQIRVADPRNEHVKVLTIRQDFTDKL